jgi:hypothetical protein
MPRMHESKTLIFSRSFQVVTRKDSSGIGEKLVLPRMHESKTFVHSWQLTERVFARFLCCYTKRIHPASGRTRMLGQAKNTVRGLRAGTGKG